MGSDGTAPKDERCPGRGNKSSSTGADLDPLPSHGNRSDSARLDGRRRPNCGKGSDSELNRCPPMPGQAARGRAIRASSRASRVHTTRVYGSCPFQPATAVPRCRVSSTHSRRERPEAARGCRGRGRAGPSRDPGSTSRNTAPGHPKARASWAAPRCSGGQATRRATETRPAGFARRPANTRSVPECGPQRSAEMSRLGTNAFADDVCVVVCETEERQSVGCRPRKRAHACPPFRFACEQRHPTIRRERRVEELHGDPSAPPAASPSERSARVAIVWRYRAAMGGTRRQAIAAFRPPIDLRST